KLVASTKSDSLMNGPVINAGDSQDVVTNQEQVDDLLDSLGF
ncbi:MAG: protein phosphatase CheZ, partial [Rhodocyclaceae bacterium]|nr:protein phosphatase CheZ [Rhodocyclaceae bacterium]